MPKEVQDRLKRMARAYVDGLFPEEEYHRQKRLLEMESLVVPEANAAEEAGKLLNDLPELWAGANLGERRRLLLAILDAVYVDAKEDKCIVAIKPKPPFRPIFQVATTREGSGVYIINEPPEVTPEARMCFWWRRGRLHLTIPNRVLEEHSRKQGGVSWLWLEGNQRLALDSDHIEHLLGQSLALPIRDSRMRP